MKIAVLGAGAAGTAITDLLTKEAAVTAVTVIDRNGNSLDELEERTNSRKLRIHRVSMEKESSIIGLLKGYNCIISALPYSQNYKVAKLALKTGIHYVDLGGDDATLSKQFKLDEAAREENIYIVPGSGFAPGLVNILAMHGYNSFTKVNSIHIRAAALPKKPKAPLNFHLSFSPVGLVNEYLNNVYVIDNGQLIEKNALDGYERFMFESSPELGELEAFYTSGISTILARHLEGKVTDFSFKTLRYTGHRDIIKAFFELGFDSQQIIDIQTSLTYRDLLVRQLKKFLPQSIEDIALAKIEVTGERDGETIKKVYELNHDHNPESQFSAMMTGTALSAVQIAMQVATRKTDNIGGVYVPEILIDADLYIKFIEDHGIKINITETKI